MYFTGNAKTQMKKHVDAHKGTLQAETFFGRGGTSILMFSSLNILGEPPPTSVSSGSSPVLRESYQLQ